jgi:hypothetical protein
MSRTILLAATMLLGTISVPDQAGALTCARGVYRAGCAGPNGAAVVRRPPVAYGRPRYYGGGRPPVACAAGPYRAGCAGPNGAAVVRRPY